MKRFVFDTLVDEENICNLMKETDAIRKAIQNKLKLILYAPRNFGKTSLLKNVIFPWFKRKHKKGFVFFADLMGVKNWESIERRVEKSFALSFSESFPAKNLLETAKRFLSRLRPQISVDALTGSPSLSFAPEAANKPVRLDRIFESIAAINRDIPTLIVLDEFQDIAFVEEAEATFRQNFQELNDVPMVLMGSKRHILSNIFAKPDAPLASFGQDLEFGFIPYEEYHRYMEERFQIRDLSMDSDTSSYLQDALCRIPEPINIVCAYLFDNFENTSVTERMVHNAIERVVESRQSRYEQFLASFSEKEEQVLCSMAKHGPVKHYNSKEFLNTVSSTSRMVGIIVNKLWNSSVMEKDEFGYSISDPLLREYLLLYR